MKVILDARRSELSLPALSLALLMCSAAWFLAAFVYCSTTGFIPDWSSTPLVWMLLLMIAPPVCFSLVLLLVNTYRQAPVPRFCRCALLAAALPVTVGTMLTVWAVIGLFSMAGIGL